MFIFNLQVVDVLVDVDEVDVELLVVVELVELVDVDAFLITERC